LAPIALYFTGLLRLLWDAVVAVVGWASAVVFSPAMWFGLSLLGLCIVLWVVGGMLIRRTTSKGAPASVAGDGKPAVGAGRTGSTGAGKPKPKKSGRAATAATDIDPELAEIEAILKDRGIN
ncbi:MAG: hypothetical protein L0H26_06930, partial [Microlunatus sp.]|nr:hypothetical protein [Microlunatus sp.]